MENRVHQTRASAILPDLGPQIVFSFCSDTRWHQDRGKSILRKSCQVRDILHQADVHLLSICVLTCKDIARLFFENSKWWNFEIPFNGLKNWPRWVSQEYHFTAMSRIVWLRTSCAWLHFADSLTTCASSEIVSQSDWRCLCFTMPKQPSTRQRVWPATMNDSSMSSWRPTIVCHDK